jgi:hypothetical protein
VPNINPRPIKAKNGTFDSVCGTPTRAKFISIDLRLASPLMIENVGWRTVSLRHTHSSNQMINHLPTQYTSTPSDTLYINPLPTHYTSTPSDTLYINPLPTHYTSTPSLHIIHQPPPYTLYINPLPTHYTSIDAA